MTLIRQSVHFRSIQIYCYVISATKILIRPYKVDTKEAKLRLISLIVVILIYNFHWNFVYFDEALLKIIYWNKSSFVNSIARVFL